MHGDALYGWLAGLVLVSHALVVAFIVGGLALIVLGNLRRWQWVNAFLFRIAHLGAIAWVAAEGWLGMDCPLTVLEMRLRAEAHGATYAGGFIEHWLQRALYYEAPPWAFALAYTIFGMLVLAAWYRFPPQRRRHERGRGDRERSAARLTSRWNRRAPPGRRWR